MSFHDPASDVSRLNRHGATRAVRVDGWTWSVIAAAIDLHRRSHGAFDIAVASALQELGLLPKLRVGRACGAPLMRDAVEILGGHRVRFRDPGACIDLGGIAKGFAVDRAVDVLRAQGVESGLVNAGGDLAAFGPNAWSIHLRDPRDPRETIGTIDIRNEALASTGRGFDPCDPALVGSTAVIDPSTRAPVGAIAGASVRARSAMMADALTKVVLIAREDAAALLDDVGASALLVRHDGEIRVTTSWQRARAA
jgi:thiamine biosynthesis lipoprotein